jgi:hypothetical protein
MATTVVKNPLCRTETAFYAPRQGQDIVVASEQLHPGEPRADPEKDVPIRNVLAFPSAPVAAPLAIEATDSSFTGIDFAPNSFVAGPVPPGAALYSREGDFGFSPPTATAPAPEVGHEIKVINCNQNCGEPLQLSFQNFARNDTGDQAFISKTHPAGFNRPTNMVRTGRLRLCRRLRGGARHRRRYPFRHPG